MRENYGFLKRSRDIPNMFWADFFLCAWVITGTIGGLIIFLLALTGCAGQPMTDAQAQILASGFQAAGAQIAQGGQVQQPTYWTPYQPLYSPVFNPQPIPAPAPWVPIPR